MRKFIKYALAPEPAIVSEQRMVSPFPLRDELVVWGNNTLEYGCGPPRVTAVTAMRYDDVASGAIMSRRWVHLLAA
jgi:hypothetical protein